MLQSAQRDGLFRRVLRITIRLSHVGQHHLRVGLGPESPRLKQRQLIPHTLLVHVQSGLDVIQSIHNEVLGGPEGVVKDGLRVVSHAVHQCLYLEVGIDFLSSCRSSVGLGLLDVPLPEKKLPIQVGYLNHVHVSDRDQPLWSCSHSHQSERLEILASERPSPNQEQLHIVNLGLSSSPEDSKLVVVPSALRLPVCRRGFGQQLEHVKI
mmetsp:Transcript_41213/g.89825  ORF Transcript_41213/g.89825 Transcript_41213/m.89825 type:complete len:209 (-) Transcript_41213:1220-1846(-)